MLALPGLLFQTSNAAAPGQSIGQACRNELAIKSKACALLYHFIDGESGVWYFFPLNIVNVFSLPYNFFK